MATFSPVNVWVAALTLPKVPLPNVLPKVKRIKYR